jgi:hypothetical protein
MDFRLLLFRSTVTTNLPFDILLAILRKKASQRVRFKPGYIDKEEANVYYVNDYAYGGYYEKLGLDRVPSMQIITNRSLVDGNKVIIKFRTAPHVFVLWGILLVLLLVFGLIIQPDFGVIPASIGLLIIYLIGLNDFAKQLSYFKYDLNLIEKEYEMKLNSD